MKTANELHAIADAVTQQEAKAKAEAEAKEKAEAMVLDCEVEAKKGRHFCKFNRYNIVNEELIINELKAHNYEVIIEGCYLMIRW